MDMRYEKISDKFDENQDEVNIKNEGKEGQQAWQLQEPPSSPPSTSSSPSHDFSFTISVHHPTAETAPDTTKQLPSFAVDLSPADDIFFHGHLLPLHLLSHLPISPRSSTNSLDSFTLLLNDENHQHHENQVSNSTNGLDHDHGMSYNDDKVPRAIKIYESVTKNDHFHKSDEEAKSRAKLKPFSLFGLPKWRKNSDIKEEEEQHQKQKRKLRFDIGNVLKRYIRMVRPILSLRNRRSSRSMQFKKQSHSFSGNTSFRDKEIRGRSVQGSAPTSTRTSPNNSGPLLTNNLNIASYKSDSTMEELQAAIQAAITHCKNSIAIEGKDKNSGCD